MTNENIVLIALAVVFFSGGFLLSIPLMKKQHREHLNDESSWVEREKSLRYKVDDLKSKATKWKDKFKKKKKK